jgi:hypothetical protein
MKTSKIAVAALLTTLSAALIVPAAYADDAADTTQTTESTTTTTTAPTDPSAPATSTVAPCAGACTGSDDSGS